MTVRIGQYELLERFAEGGMAEVYFARFMGVEGFRRECAIKRLLPEQTRRPEVVEMFLDEARLAASLLHPNIVQVFDLGESDGTYFMAMELVDGPHIGRLFAHSLRVAQPLPIELCAWIISQAADGLHHAHTRVDPATGRTLGIVHRDMSPQNVLVSRWGDVKITDFGIAKMRERRSRTRAGVMKGKLGYLSPEQCLGRPLDRRSDVFALGIMLYELLTRRRLYKEGSELEVMQRITTEEPLPPSVRNPDVDVVLSEIALRALRKEPDQRFQSAAELGDALSAWLGRRGVADVRAALSFWVRTHAGKIWRTAEERAQRWQMQSAPSERVAPRRSQSPNARLPGPHTPNALSPNALSPNAERPGEPPFRSAPPDASHRRGVVSGNPAAAEISASEASGAMMLRRPALDLPTTSFIGRRGLLRDLEHRLDQRDRWLSLVGPAGVGKSRLALQMLHELGDLWRAEGGAWRVDLTGIDSGPGVCVAVARHLNIPLVGVADDHIAGRIGSALAARGRVLLVLDQVDAVAPRLGPLLRGWLRTATQLQLVVAGRERMGTTDEKVIDVPPLSLPVGHRISGSDAVLLFAARAASARPGFRVAAADPKVICDLVRQLDGLPLALEFAAARIAVLEPADLLARLDRRFEVLGGPGERSSLRDALAESWDALQPDARAALVACVPFRGGFDLMAAEAVLGPDALRLLDTLRDYSLIRTQPDPIGGAARFDLLHSIRAFAEERARDTARGRDHARGDDPRSDDATAGAAERQALHYGAQVGGWLLGQHRRGSPAAARRLQGERGNLSVALTWYSAHGTPERGPKRGAQALDLAEALLSGGRSGGTYTRRADILRLAVAAGAAGPRLERLRSTLLLEAGRMGEARRAAELALSGTHGAAADMERVEGLLLLARVARSQGALEEASTCAQQALALSERLSSADKTQPTGDPLEMGAQAVLFGRSLASVGRVHLERGELELATKHLERAADALRMAGDAPREAAVRTQLGRAYLNLRRLRDAETAIGAALVSSQQRGTTANEAQLMWLQACLHLERGEADAAVSALRHADAGARTSGDASLAMQVRLLDALRSLLGGQTSRALARLDGVDVDTTVVGKRERLRHELLVAHACAAAGDLTRAEAACRAAQGWLADDTDHGRWAELSLAIAALERAQAVAGVDAEAEDRARLRVERMMPDAGKGSQWLRLSLALYKRTWDAPGEPHHD